MGALQYGSGIISSLLLALFSDGTPWTMGWIIALFTLASAVIALNQSNKLAPIIINILANMNLLAGLIAAFVF